MPIDNLEQDTDIERDNTAPESDSTADIIRAALKEQADINVADEDIFSDPGDVKEHKMVSVEDGLDLIEKNRTKDRDAPKEDEAEEEQPASDAVKKIDTAEKPADSAPLDADVSALLADVPEAKRGPIMERLTAAAEIMGLFQGRDAELQMHGVNPVQAMSSLIKMNEYAQREPDKYLAWAASQIAQGANTTPEAFLGKADEHLGYKLVALDATNDPFEDEEVKRLREENRSLRLKQGLPFGPDTPSPEAEQQRIARDLETWKTGKTDLDILAPIVGQKAKAAVEATGKPVTVTDLDRFYDEAKGELTARLTSQQTIVAAQGAAPMAQGSNTTAARDAKALAASKMLDGSGQGADRRPASTDDMSISALVARGLRASRSE